jgi:hypothetical protein
VHEEDLVMRKASRWLVVLLVAGLAVPGAAAARTQPITLSYTGTSTPPTTVSTQPLIAFTTDTLAGSGSPLGRFTAIYPHLVNFDALTFDGLAVFTGERGDRIVIHLGGSGAPLSPTIFAVTFAGTIVGGTGRFQGASGSVGGPGTVDLAALTVSATLTGTIRT